MKMVGVLLAAGRGSRFDPSGERHKLLATLPGGEAVAAASARAMLAALPRVVAVVADGASPLAALLASAGCEVTVCARAADGMAASLVHALRHTLAQADGWVIGLADMPFVQSSTVSALAAAIANGATAAVPVFDGQRGNPVAFSARHRDALLALTGDQGARALLRTLTVCEVPVADAGIRRDIDLPSDLPA